MRINILIMAFIYSISALATLNLNKFNFTTFPYLEFIPTNTVKRTFQSHSGYIWFGTESGICRYDGYNVLVFKSAIGTPNILTSNNILCIAEDYANRIWIGTDQGVNIMTEQGQIINLFSSHPVNEIKINSLFSTSKEMWIGTENGLYAYNYSTNSIKTFKNVPDQPNSLSGDNINYIFEDSSGILWIAIWNNGLCQYDRKKNQFIRLPKLGKYNNPFRLFEDKNHVMWVTSWGDGLISIIPENKRKLTGEYYHFINRSISAGGQSGIIYGITQDDKFGHIWLLTHRGLVIMENDGKEVFQPVNIADYIPNGSNYLHDLYKDKQGNIWLGAANDGVYMLNNKIDFFTNNELTEIRNKAGYVIISTIVEHDDLLWLGVTNFGICVIDTKTGLLSKKVPVFDDYVSYHTMSINPLDSSIWAAGIKVKKITKKGNKYISQELRFNFREENRILDPKEFSNVNNIMFDHKNRLWMATQEGLYLLLANNDIMKISSGDYRDVTTICQHKENIFWVGSISGGILKLTEKKENKFEKTYYNTKNSKINCNSINCIYKDERSRLWVGTQINGLHLYDEVNEKFISQNEKFAITEETVMGITDGPNGDLWISTTDRIIKIDLENSVSQTFSRSENILITQFRARSLLFSKSGALYFGGTKGFTSTLPGSYIKNKTNSRVVFTDIEIHNQPVFNNPQSHHFNNDKKKVFLSYKEQNIGIEFSSLNYLSPTTVKYAYMLEGVDDDWQFVDSKRRFVNYHNLSHGKYTFHVKATNDDGVWSSNISQLEIIVETPPYLRWWAYIIYWIIALVIFYFIYSYLKYKIDLRNTVIIAKIEKEKAEELIQAKLRYFTNVSHELLTPLTIINCLVNETKTNNFVKFDYETMHANINRLKRLLQQILDFRKTESGNMKLNVSMMDIVAYIQNICSLNFNPLIKANNIHFSINTSEDVIMAWFDQDKIDKVLYNLLSNAFKYTPAGGNINVTIQLEVKGQSSYIKVFVSDTGIGIPFENQQHIFKRFYSERKAEANGIGLALTKDLVELHKGNIFVESEEGKGTTFVFEIPISKNQFIDEIESNSVIQILHDDINQEVSHNFEDKHYLHPNEEGVKHTLLLVEDNLDLLRVIGQILSKKYHIINAVNGQEALDIIQSEQDISVIISDVKMPVMDGLTLCKLIKENINSSHIPVILLTAHNQLDDRIACYNIGADAFISKPFEPEVLDSRIQNLIRKSENNALNYKNNNSLDINTIDFSSLDEEFLKKALRMVEENIANPDFTHEQLIEKLNTSKSTLYRKLKHLTSLSPWEFVQNIRIKHARILMDNELANISEIAYATGFSSPKYFAVCFKEEFGVSPREFLKNKKKTTKDSII